ncbi:monooxygenase 2-like [Telopea speciosissima]|uniref:monooxygenase 2-like n=1 Tax=Telopea speciosissima TaxID=54955 RepID=UPI001CC63CC1|nr:monooxygenase 2-like [Telopea speciosissima]
MEISEEEVVIVGGGIAGLATALALKRVGIRALVLERSRELRTTGAALALFPNAWLALQALGVAHKLTPIYSPLQKNQPTTVHRKALLETLAEELSPGTIRFSSKLTSIRTVALDDDDDETSCVAILSLDDGTVIKAKVLIGCDGVHSVVARWLGLMDPVNANRSAMRGLAVFTQGHGYNKGEVYQFIDQGKRAGFVPLTDKGLYWFLTYTSTFNGEETPITDPKLLQKDVMENLAKDFPSVFLEVVQHADLETLTWAPLTFRLPWDLIFGHVYKGSITVAGDAMHPMTPDLAQGGGSALEDAVVLGRHLGNSYLSLGVSMGWVQQSGSSLFMKFLRDAIFYKFLYPRVFAGVNYDCGKLPDIEENTN